MKKFIVQTILFVAMATAIITASVVVSNRVLCRNASFVVPGNINTIVVGHSHPECAFNDSLILNFKNFSRSGESYFYTYHKLTGLLAQNKNIRAVFVEFSNDQLDKNKDEWIWGASYMGYAYPTYAPFMDREAQCLLFRKNFKSFLNNQSILLKKNLNTIKERDYDYTKKIGGYEYSVRDKTDSILAIFDQLYKADSSGFSISPKNIYYLQKIINECRKENRQVYLVRSPLHPRFPGLNNESFFWESLHSKFPGIEFLDFKDFPLANAEFGNLEHLNFRGARKFSLFVNGLLEKGLLDKTNKQEFIDSEMMKIRISMVLTTTH